VDLLTVVTHELGHLLGQVDVAPWMQAHSIMTDTLPTGVRRLVGWASSPSSGDGLKTRPTVSAQTLLAMSQRQRVVDSVFSGETGSQAKALSAPPSPAPLGGNLVSELRPATVAVVDRAFRVAERRSHTDAADDWPDWLSWNRVGLKDER
jgi:hypothetical protein